MPFPREIRETTLVRSRRRCCVCHEFGGRSVNVHHIIQEADGGQNSLENAICLCLRCHAEAGHYNPRHPLGTKYSVGELRKHRDEWWRHCEKNPEEPFGLFLDVSFRSVHRTVEVHRYRLIVKYKNTLREVHNGWRVEIFIPACIPLDWCDFDVYENIEINGQRYSKIEYQSHERIFPGQEIEIGNYDDIWFIAYEINNHLFMNQDPTWKVMWRFFTSNAPVVEGEKPLNELHEF